MCTVGAKFRICFDLKMQWIEKGQDSCGLVKLSTLLGIDILVDDNWYSLADELHRWKMIVA